jgi:methionine-rich copper-binding protein CopC
MRMSQHIRKNLFKAIAVQLVLIGMLVIVLPSVPAHASSSGISPEGLPTANATPDNIKRILQIVFGIIGAFAVLNITLSGLKYITSAGDPQKTSEAKNGIVYSLVGLAIAITAEAIVAFVVTQVSGS